MLVLKGSQKETNQPFHGGGGFLKKRTRPNRDSNGCGRRGKPQVLVHVSTYQGTPFWNRFFEPQPKRDSTRDSLGRSDGRSQSVRFGSTTGAGARAQATRKVQRSRLGLLKSPGDVFFFGDPPISRHEFSWWCPIEATKQER